MNEHKFTIAGLDRSFCVNCQKWIVSEAELNSIKISTEKARKDKPKAEWQEWQKYFNFVKKSYLNCVKKKVGENAKTMIK